MAVALHPQGAPAGIINRRASVPTTYRSGGAGGRISSVRSARDSGHLRVVAGVAASRPAATPAVYRRRRLVLGGIVAALPLLGDAPFIAVSGDIVSDFDYRPLVARAAALASGAIDGHLVLVDNPPFNPRGDMGLAGDRITTVPPHLTYGNIALLAPRLFAGEPAGRRKLFPWLYRAVDAGRIGGERFAGRWHNVGTPDELARLDAELSRQPLAVAG